MAEIVLPCNCKVHTEDRNYSHGGRPHIHPCREHDPNGITMTPQPQGIPATLLVSEEALAGLFECMVGLTVEDRTVGIVHGLAVDSDTAQWMAKRVATSPQAQAARERLAALVQGFRTAVAIADNKGWSTIDEREQVEAAFAALEAQEKATG